ncbi:MAG: alpha/beta fold hydrolase [Bacteroidota bacterium]
MHAILTSIQILFKLLAILPAAVGGKLAFRLFCRPLNRKIRKRELGFYQEARHFLLRSQDPPIHAYELGQADGQLVILVHGWEGNAGNFYEIAKALAATGHRVISLDFPAHGKSDVPSTNLKVMADALIALLEALQPKEPFSIVSHSFGSAVTSYALAGQSWKIDQLIFLTSPNVLIDILRFFQGMMKFNDRIFDNFAKRVEKVAGRHPADTIVGELVKEIEHDQLTIIHDQYDQVLPYANSTAIAQMVPAANLIPIDHVGHYRMLWDEEVVSRIGTLLNSPQKQQVH